MPVGIYCFDGFERSLGRVRLLRDVSFLKVPFGLVCFFRIIYGIVLLFGVTLEDAAEKCLRVRERIKHLQFKQKPRQAIHLFETSEVNTKLNQ